MSTAVITGLGRTGRLVTSAALILFLAFVSLASGPETEVKILATALAAGILLDATVVRGLLVPALVSLFGVWNWWLPRPLARVLRVPHHAHEWSGSHRPASGRARSTAASDPGQPTHQPERPSVARSRHRSAGLARLVKPKNKEDGVKYAVLGYDSEGSLDALPAGDKHTLHGAHRALHDDAQAEANSSVRVIAHYRFRPPRDTTTVRLAGDEVVTSEGPAAETSKALRALYLLESDDPDAVVALATRLPAVRMGGTVEIWPLAEPDRHERRPHES